MAGIEVFLSYSHVDEGHLVELVKHLGLLRRQGLIDPWYDRRIEAGANVHAEIEAKVESAHVFLLLISPDFVHSDYCYDREMERAMERHHEGSATVIPAILRPCDWHSAPFGGLLAIPKDGRTVTEHENRDRAYLEIARAVRRIAEQSRPRTEAESGVAVSGELEESRARTQSGEGLGLVSSPAESVVIGGHSDNLTIRKEFSDWEKDRFGHEAFESIAGHFETSLNKLEQRYVGTVQCTFRRIDATSFEATAYIDGRQASHCGVWVGGDSTFSRNRDLGYNSGGVGNRNSYNEILQVADDGYCLYLRPTMGMFGLTGGQQSENLSPGDAAEHLWRMFMEPMR